MGTARLLPCLVVAIGLGVTGCARGPVAHQGAGVKAQPVLLGALDVAAARAETIESPARPLAPWVGDLVPITIFDTHSQRSCRLRLYAEDGSIDEAAATEVDRLFDEEAAAVEERHVNRRLLQLVTRAAWHFHKDTVTIVSAWRASKRKASRHVSGEAIDFAVAGVPSGAVAAHLRTYPRVGVGIYTHPRTRFVHLDVREVSFHWLDASPPGKTWREKGITDRAAPSRDSGYRPAQDLPESAAMSGG